MHPPARHVLESTEDTPISGTPSPKKSNWMPSIPKKPALKVLLVTAGSTTKPEGRNFRWATAHLAKWTPSRAMRVQKEAAGHTGTSRSPLHPNFRKCRSLECKKDGGGSSS